MTPPPIWPNQPPREITPRNIDPNPRCPDCRDDGDPRNGHPMKHPEHRWGPCIVQLAGQPPCPCERRGAI